MAQAPAQFTHTLFPRISEMRAEGKGLSGTGWKLALNRQAVRRALSSRA
jgi:hypothetical protein